MHLNPYYCSRFFNNSHLWPILIIDLNQAGKCFDLQFDEDDGFSSTEIVFFESQMSVMEESIKEYLTNPKVTAIERYGL